jgi:hypothetical protein
MEIPAFSKCEVYDSALIRAHWTKHEGNAGGSYTLCCVLGHGAELCFTGCAKAVHIAYKPLTRGKPSSKRLVDQVLQCVKQLAAFSL